MAAHGVNGKRSTLNQMENKQVRVSEIVLLLMLTMCAIAIAPHFALRAESDLPPIINLPKGKATHPKQRNSASPRGDLPVRLNPPSLVWPIAPGKNIRYAVRLSQDANFGKDVLFGENLDWAMFNPHQQLASGRWYWQYAVERSGNRKWSQLYRFVVPDSARVFVTPTAAALAQRCPRMHPRILITAEEWTAFRNRVRGEPEAEAILRDAETLIGAPLPGEDQGLPNEKGKNKFEERKFKIWAAKRLAARMSDETIVLAKAYLLARDERYGREAVRRALHVAAWDPDGVTSIAISNFADGNCYYSMALAYDSGYELMTAEERQTVREAITYRMRRNIAGWMNRIEGQLFGAHNWQHLVQQSIDAAVATLGDLPEASTWLAYLYELWLARVPLLGGEDGGWANGNSYFKLNYYTQTHVPFLFSRLAGSDFFQHPWYQNVIYFLIYTWPPGSYCDGFGDGFDRLTYPHAPRLAWADMLARLFGNPHASWYVQACIDQNPQVAKNNSKPETHSRKLLSDFLRWYRLRVGTGEKILAAQANFDLPQARCFKDIGLVTMHTDLAQPKHNVMIAMRCSSFGAHNHMHADQNSFNILCGGLPLFYNSGYYIAFGDRFHKGWYKHTRGQNSVLIDGKGQEQSSQGYGWIARFLHGDKISYCLGDASNAYGSSGLTTFRRHLIFLRPSLVVIYDQLEADHNATWQWLLHSRQPIVLNHDRGYCETSNAFGKARAQLYASAPLQLDVNDQFDPPAENWANRKDDRGKVIAYANQYHFAAKSTQKIREMRYLAVIQVAGTNGFTNDVEIVDEGTLQVGDWQIWAELKSQREPALEINNKTESRGVAFNMASITLGDKSYIAQHHESILVEEVNGTTIVKRTDDCLPRDAAELLSTE